MSIALIADGTVGAEQPLPFTIGKSFERFKKRNTLESLPGLVFSGRGLKCNQIEKGGSVLLVDLRKKENS